MQLRFTIWERIMKHRYEYPIIAAAVAIWLLWLVLTLLSAGCRPRPDPDIGRLIVYTDRQTQIDREWLYRKGFRP